MNTPEGICLICGKETRKSTRGVYRKTCSDECNGKLNSMRASELVKRLRKEGRRW